MNGNQINKSGLHSDADRFFIYFLDKTALL